MCSLRDAVRCQAQLGMDVFPARGAVVPAVRLPGRVVGGSSYDLQRLRSACRVRAMRLGEWMIFAACCFQVLDLVLVRLVVPETVL